MSDGTNQPQGYCTNCGAEIKLSILMKMWLVCVAAVLFASCNSQSTNPDQASNDNSNTRDDQRRSTASQTPNADETIESAPPLQVTTAEPQQAQDLTSGSVDVDGDGDADYSYRIYVRYENYLNRQDMSSVYMGVAVQELTIGAYSPFSPDLMAHVLEQLPHYDFVLLSVYDDDTGDYINPLSYTNSEEVAGAYKDYLYEHADEFVKAVMEGSSPAEIEKAERNFRKDIITQYTYEDDMKILASATAPNIPPWVYSDRKGEVLGDAPGQTSRTSAPPESTTSTTPEATTSGSYFPTPYEAQADAQEAAGEYYRAAGVEDWDYTYEHLEAETQSLFTREEWYKKNQWFADNGSVTYEVLSGDAILHSEDAILRPGTTGPLVKISLSLTYEDGTSSTRTTYFVYEDGAWKHAFGQEEYDLFMPDASYEEFVQAQQ